MAKKFRFDTATNDYKEINESELLERQNSDDPFLFKIESDGNYYELTPEEKNKQKRSSPTLTREQAKFEAASGRVRYERNRFLEETDRFALQDRTMSQEMIDYRQALRDVPQQEGFPHEVIWPEKPSV